MFSVFVTQCFVRQIGQRRGLVDAVLRHVAVGRPLAAGDAEQAGLVDVDGVIARERGGVLAVARS